MKYQVLEYRSAGGKKVVKAFLERQTVKVQARALRLIDMLQNGPNLGMPYSKKIHTRLFELRIMSRPAMRILYTYRGNKIYLLHVFLKKAQKIPKKEIKTALTRLDSIYHI